MQNRALLKEIMALGISVTALQNLLKKEMWRPDHRLPGWEYRRVYWTDAAMVFERRNPGTGGHNYEFVYYWGNNGVNWKTHTEDDIRKIVPFINGHIEDAHHTFQDDLNTESKHIARQYVIKKACVTNDAAKIPTVGEMIVKVDLFTDGIVALHTDRGKQVTIHTFDSRYPTRDPWDTSREHLTWVSPDKIKTAALVGTDSATIWAIAPENLGRLFAGGFGTLLNAWNEGDFEEAERAWREHGGAVFHTGADGFYDVKIPTPEGNLPIVEEKGYLPPYGTPEYSEWFEEPPYGD